MEEMSIGEFARRSRLSAKALRRYDGLGILSPARVDDLSGYRYYDSAQLDQARLISTLRHLDVPLADVKAWLALEPAEIAEQVRAYWSRVERRHGAQRDLLTVLIDRLNGGNTIMLEVATREIPQRTVLCLKRNVGPAEAWAFGKEFLVILSDPRLPWLEGREGAAFSIYWGEVSADSDGPVEWCKPIPEADAAALAAQFPDLELRVEPAHHEAYVALGPGGAQDAAQWELASESLRAWAEDQEDIDERQLATHQDLGIRVTYLMNRTERTTDCDFAVPFV